MLGDGGRGFFKDGIDLVNRPIAADQFAADGSIRRELALARGLHGGDGGVFGDGDVNQLTGATGGTVRDVEVIADEVEKWLFAYEFASAENGVAVAARGGLRDETHARAQRAAGLGVGRLVAWADDHAKFLDPGARGFLEDDLEGGLGFALLVDEGLQRKRALAGVGCGDEGFADGHGREEENVDSAWPRPTIQPERTSLRSDRGG